MKKIRAVCLSAVSLALFASCSRNNSNGDNGPLPAPAPVDTLSGNVTRLATIGGNLYDIFFTDTLNGYTGGDALYRTTDGGRSWSQLTVNGVVPTVSNIGARGSRAAFTTGNAATVLFTTNSGGSLQSATYTTASGAPGFSDVFFATADTVFYSSGRYVWRSVFGGAMADTVFNFNDGALDDKTLFFLDGSRGWNLRQGKLYRTTNGGASWTNLGGPGGNAGGMHFINAQVGFFGVGSNLYGTTDGGVSINQIANFGSSGYLDVYFSDAQNGVVVFGNKIFRTTNGGSSWSVIATTAGALVELHFTDARNGWVCGANGAVYRIWL